MTTKEQAADMLTVTDGTVVIRWPGGDTTRLTPAVALALCDALVRHLPEIQAESWIPCSRAVPPSGLVVWARCEDGAERTLSRTGDAWHTPDGSLSRHAPTHWRYADAPKPAPGYDEHGTPPL